MHEEKMQFASAWRTSVRTRSSSLLPIRTFCSQQTANWQHRHNIHSKNAAISWWWKLDKPFLFDSPGLCQFSWFQAGPPNEVALFQQLLNAVVPDQNCSVRIAVQGSTMLNLISIICNHVFSHFSAGVSSHALRCVRAAGLFLDSNRS